MTITTAQTALTNLQAQIQAKSTAITGVLNALDVLQQNGATTLPSSFNSYAGQFTTYVNYENAAAVILAQIIVDLNSKLS